MNSEELIALSAQTKLESNGNHYIRQFMNLNCAPDVLRIAAPISNIEKEVTESMSMITRLRRIVLANEPWTWTLFDLCAGNGLTSVIASHLYPLKQTYAIDLRRPNRDWHKVRNFSFEQRDINDNGLVKLIHDAKPCIIISVHPCRDLAKRVMDLYLHSFADHVILMPCCEGDISSTIPFPIRNKIGKYLSWSYTLHQIIADDTTRLEVDTKCISPKNAIIVR